MGMDYFHWFNGEANHHKDDMMETGRYEWQE